MGGKHIKARIGDVMMTPGNVRGIVIGMNGTFVKVLAIGTSKETADTVVLRTFMTIQPANACIWKSRGRIYDPFYSCVDELVIYCQAELG